MNIKPALRAVMSLTLLSTNLPLYAEGMPDLSAAYGSLRPAASDFKVQSEARAQERKKPAAKPDDKKPEDETCDVCWNSNFKPLNEKARVVKEWETLRVQFKATSAVVGVVSIFLLLNPAAWKSLDEGTRTYLEQKRKLEGLRSRAIALGGLEVTEGVLKVKLVKGADYVFEAAPKK